MLSDGLLQERYVKYLTRLTHLAEKEIDRTKSNEELHATAEMYLERFNRCMILFRDTYGGNVVGAFRKLQDKGLLEIITCGATHGYLPNMQMNPNAVRAQILTAVNSYRRFMDRDPQGIWLPECGYYPVLRNIFMKLISVIFLLKHTAFYSQNPVLKMVFSHLFTVMKHLLRLLKGYRILPLCMECRRRVSGTSVIPGFLP
jgi:1,4-alpha-glucan branching enzyme